MGDSSQKAKKGKRTTRRTDTKGTTVKERRKADAQKVKAHAQRVIGDALNADDSSIRSYQDIPRMLRDETLKYALPSDHFDILDATDLCDLFIQIKSKSQNQLASLGPRPQQPTLNTKIQHGQTTPVPSPATTECDVQSEGRAEQDRDEEATEEDLVVAPLEGEEGEKFNVNIYSASRAGPEIVKAYYCQNDRSYISINIIGRHRLRPDLDDTIRLTWEESDISRQGPKMKSTRFWIVEDDKVRNDLAIGKEHDQLDEPDAECGRLDLKHPELTDETSESGDDEDDDSSPDRSDDEDDEEDAEDAEEDDQEGLSETSEVDDEESDSEDAADEEQMSSDDSYVRISPRNQLIGAFIPQDPQMTRH
ncbi:hypothetical protein BDV96DRAFT_578516 [Lophiotrema nucula]|uniref:Uncharacterized protein n=1 Tax=Lophiotrema nucula TaxID=690887 RepID=A0A6A5Z145_9PLEO|nr:hypothetical protein BDV96DRAFT_578516 [Lophiotrema nucula]